MFVTGEIDFLWTYVCNYLLGYRVVQWIFLAHAVLSEIHLIPNAEMYASCFVKKYLSWEKYIPYQGRDAIHQAVLFRDYRW